MKIIPSCIHWIVFKQAKIIRTLQYESFWPRNNQRGRVSRQPQPCSSLTRRFNKMHHCADTGLKLNVCFFWLNCFYSVLFSVCSDLKLKAVGSVGLHIFLFWNLLDFSRVSPIYVRTLKCCGALSPHSEEAGLCWGVSTFIPCLSFLWEVWLPHSPNKKLVRLSGANTNGCLPLCVSPELATGPGYEHTQGEYTWAHLSSLVHNRYSWALCASANWKAPLQLTLWFALLHETPLIGFCFISRWGQTL